MSRLTRIRPEFVTFAPEVLEPGVAYVSMEYATVLHLCCCGCASQVVTPLAPARWHLTFDGESISLNPSIGNWSFPCQSHYWIRRNQVLWDRPLNEAEIAWVRETDRQAMKRRATPRTDPIEEPPLARRPSWIERIRRFWSQ